MKLNYLVIFTLPVVIFLTNLLALTFSDITYKTYFKNTEDLHYVFNVVNYLKLNKPLDNTYFSDQAAMHMQDVRNLFNLTKAINSVVIFILSTSIILTIKKKRYLELKKSLMLGIIICFLVSLVIFSANLLNFEFAFVLFHKIFFKNNLWLFPPGDTLVNLFTEDFFIYFFKKLVTNILITLILVLVATNFIPNNDPKRN